jgi:hypothetical protein
MAYGEKIQFRLFVMPCCHYQLCWVNPRYPTYCPECGKNVYLELKTGAHTPITSEGWLRVDNTELGGVLSQSKPYV